MTAAVPLVERLAEVQRAHILGRPGFASEAECSCGWRVLHPRNADGASRLTQHRAHVARALLPVVEQAVAEARGEALREAAEAVGPALQSEVGGHTSTYSVRRWLRDRADAIATTEGAPRPRWVDLFGAAPDFPCHHDWSLRPESDTFACGICGEER